VHLASPARTRRAACVAVTAALLCGPAGATLIEVDLDAEPAASHTLQVKPRGAAELCTKLVAGQAVKWSYRAAAPLDFNIHHHEGRAVRYSARRRAAAGGRGTLAVKVTQTYCWMWTSRATREVALTAHLER
jgi:hypothetical protein